MKKLKNVRSNKITIICMILLISLFSIFTPMATFCVDNATVEISEDLNNSIIDELNEIDFSDLNGVIEEFQNNSTNIFSIDNIKSKIYSIISGENAVSYSSFFASVFSIFVELIVKYLPMLSLIVAIGVISNLLNGIKSKFNEKSTSASWYTTGVNAEMSGSQDTVIAYEADRSEHMQFAKAFCYMASLDESIRSVLMRANSELLFKYAD